MKQRKIRINAIVNAQLIKLLLEGIYTCHEIAEQTGLYITTVQRYVNALYKAKAAHIADWEEDLRGRETIKIFKLGKGRDAKPRKLTRAQVARRYRERKKHANRMVEVVLPARPSRVQASSVHAPCHDGAICYDPSS